MIKSKYSLLIRNSMWGTVSFLFITLISFLILPFIISKLSIVGYGIYILITSLIGYYGILDLGLGNALIKYVAEFYEKKEIELLNRYINSAVIIQAIIGIVASGAILFFAKGILSLLNINPKEMENANIALNLSAIGFFFTFIGGAYKSVLQGLQLFKITSIIDSIINSLLNISLLIILYLGYGLIGAVSINVAVALVSFFAYYIIMKNNYTHYKIRFSLDFMIMKQILNFSIFVFLSKISNVFATYIVRFVISFYLGPAAVTYYVVPSKVVGALGGIAGSAISAIFPFSSQLSVNNDQNEAKKLYLQGSRLFAAILFPIVIFISVFSKQILTLWMGNLFAEKTWLVLSIISFSSFIGSFSAIPNLIILGQGNSKLIGMFSLITISLYLIFIPTLTNLFGIIGTSFALLIASIGIIYYVIHKTTELTNIRIREYYDVVVRPHVGILLVAIVIFLCIMVIKSQDIFTTIFVGATLMSLHYIYLIKLKIIPFKNIFNKLL